MSSRLRHCLPHFVMLLVSIALYVAAMQIDTSYTEGGRRIGPDFWPKAVILFMGALSLYEVVKRAIVGSDFTARGLTENLTHNPAGDPTPETADEAPAVEYPRLLIAGCALILGYVAVVDLLGFFVTTAVFLFAFTWVGGFRRHGWNALISVLGAFFMVVMFMRIAYISLPLGVGPFRSLSLALLTLIGVH
jgi:putative tricarboxylic transport membrane protein